MRVGLRGDMMILDAGRFGIAQSHALVEGDELALNKQSSGPLSVLASTLRNGSEGSNLFPLHFGLSSASHDTCQ